MSKIQLHEIGEVIRKVRKERGLRLEDLADENISPATVSNIERGVAHVSPEKVTYLLDKLNLSLQKLPEIIEKQQQNLSHIQFQIQTIATLNEIGKPDEALKLIEKLSLDDHHPYNAEVYYYKGKCYYTKNKFRQAERAINHALRFIQQNDLSPNNLEAANYLVLGMCKYKQNDLHQALEYTNHGLKAWTPNGGRKHIRFLLYRNKGIYLQRLGRVIEGMQLVLEVWDEIEHIDMIGVKLSFYWLRADFSKRSGFIEDAIHYALQGMDLSRRNIKFQFLFDFWTMLGGIHVIEQKWDLANKALQTALSMRGKFPDDSRLSTVYTQLGIFYYHQDNLQNAKEAFQEAVSLSEKFHDVPRLISNLMIIGEVLIKQSNIPSAIHYLKTGLELANKHGYPEQEAKIWFQLAGCYEHENETEFQSCMRNAYQLHQVSRHTQNEWFSEVI